MKEKRDSLQYRRIDKAILAAFAYLGGKMPFEKITVQDILDEALVSQYTSYAHFQDKYAVAERLQNDEFFDEYHAKYPDRAIDFNEYGADGRFAGVCGIHLENGKITMMPRPHKSLQYAKAVYNSPIGEITSGWRYEGEQVIYDIQIPSNAEAEIILPDGRREILGAGSYVR